MMNKRFLGLKISTYLTALVCLFAAFLLWIMINVSAELAMATDQNSISDATTGIFNFVNSLL